MILNANSRYISLTGNDIPTELYSKIIELDRTIFSNDSEEFQGDTAVDENILLSYLHKNILTTTIIYDQTDDKVIGYYQAFPLSEDFLQGYISGQKTFADMTENDIEVFNPYSKSGQKLYIWSIGVLDEYRGGFTFKDSHESELNGKNPVKVLVEALARAVINLKKQGVYISEIYAEGVSGKGQSLASGLTGDRILHEDKVNDFILYGNEFKFENMVARLSDEVRQNLIRQYNSTEVSSDEKLGDDIEKLVTDNTNKDANYSKRGENDI